MEIPESGNVTGATVAGLLAKYRFNFQSESELQRAISLVLAEARISHEREVYLGRLGRLDFLCRGGLAIEVKLASNKGRAALLRQLAKYAESSRVVEILVVTGGLISDIPSSVGGKIVTAHYLLGSSF